jgi:RES domain-containing protein
MKPNRKAQAFQELFSTAAAKAVAWKGLRCQWRESIDKGREALTQAIGRAAVEEGLEGLLVPSVQVRKGVNLVVFPESLVKDSSLKIQNSERLPAPHD